MNGDVSHIVTRIWSSSPEVFKAGDGGQTLQIHGRNFLIRSDFPVLVFFDGRPVAQVNGFFPPVQRIKIPRTSPSPKTMTLRFPPGEGATSTGVLVAADVQGRHGNFCMDCSASDEIEPEMPNPDLLPCTTFAQVSGGIAAGPHGLWGFITWNLADFRLPFNQTLVNEFYVKAVGWGSENDSQGPAPDGEYVYEITLEKSDVPVGDGEVLFTLEGALQAQMIAMGNTKLPIRALFAQYAAETPTLTSAMFGTARTASRIVTMRMVGGYM